MTIKSFNPETDEIPEGYGAIAIGMHRDANKSLVVQSISTSATDGPDQAMMDLIYQIALLCEMGGVALSANDIFERYQTCLAVAVEEAPVVLEGLMQSMGMNEGPVH